MRYLERKNYRKQCNTFEKNKTSRTKIRKKKTNNTNKTLQKFPLKYICKNKSYLNIVTIMKLGKLRL